MEQRRKVNGYKFPIGSRAIYILPIASIVLTVIGCINMPKQTSSPLSVVPYVDLNRYTGIWYEIARYPHSFQEGCVGSKATYTLRDDGKISVLNECYDKSFYGKVRYAKGKAWVVDKETNAKLKVSFFWPFSGHYWIIDLGENYDYAVVGHPDRKYLWILSRSPEIDEQLFNGIIEKLKTQSYDTGKLTRTLQIKKTE